MSVCRKYLVNMIAPADMKIISLLVGSVWSSCFSFKLLTSSSTAGTAAIGLPELGMVWHSLSRLIKGLLRVFRAGAWKYRDFQQLSSLEKSATVDPDSKCPVFLSLYAAISLHFKFHLLSFRRTRIFTSLHTLNPHIKPSTSLFPLAAVGAVFNANKAKCPPTTGLAINGPSAKLPHPN